MQRWGIYFRPRPLAPDSEDSDDPDGSDGSDDSDVTGEQEG